jgi:hypothetical protein
MPAFSQVSRQTRGRANDVAALMTKPPPREDFDAIKLVVNPQPDADLVASGFNTAQNDGRWSRSRTIVS